MPPFYRVAEISAYALLNLLPFMFLAIYPFRKQLRFSRTCTILLCSAVALMQVFFGYLASFVFTTQSGTLSVASTITYILFYLSAVKIHFGKAVFTLFMMSNIANFTVCAAKCIEGQIFPELAQQSYRWSFSVILLFWDAFFLIPLFFYIKRYYTPAVEKEPSGKEWRYLWLIPASFYITWFYGLYGNETKSSLQIALRPGNAIFFFFINLGACLVYSVVASLILAQEKNVELLERNHQLTLHAMQYENLQERIADARRAKHDVRHHITLLQEYVKNKNFDELTLYLNSYQRNLPDDTLLSFCENQAANAVLLYYAQQAKDNGIDYIIKTAIPKELGIADNDLSVLLGNLLENALHACMDEKGQNRKIILHAEAANNSLYLTVDNTFTGTIKKNSSDVFYSTKHKGIGIGIESVKHIASSYNGTYQSEQKDGMFMTSVMLLMRVEP